MTDSLLDSPGMRDVVEAMARADGYKPPIDGVLGSGFEQMLAHDRACRMLLAALGVQRPCLLCIDGLVPNSEGPPFRCEQCGGTGTLGPVLVRVEDLEEVGWWWGGDAPTLKRPTYVLPSRTGTEQ